MGSESFAYYDSGGVQMLRPGFVAGLYVLGELIEVLDTRYHFLRKEEQGEVFIKTA